MPSLKWQKYKTKKFYCVGSESRLVMPAMMIMLMFMVMMMVLRNGDVDDDGGGENVADNHGDGFSDSGVVIFGICRTTGKVLHIYVARILEQYLDFARRAWPKLTPQRQFAAHWENRNWYFHFLSCIFPAFGRFYFSLSHIKFS